MESVSHTAVEVLDADRIAVVREEYISDIASIEVKESRTISVVGTKVISVAVVLGFIYWAMKNSDI